jgi:hypothetical protein
METLITLTANNVFVLSELVVVIFLGFIATRSLTDETRIIVAAWLLVSLGYLIRIGYWSTAIYLAEQGQLYADWAHGSHRAFFTAIPALMVLSGNLIFIGYLEKIPVFIRVLIGVLIVLIALFIALTKWV